MGAMDASALANIFRQLDLDGNGVLDEFELRQGLRALGFKGAEFEEIYRFADKDGDGLITLAEFQNNLDGRARRRLTEQLNEDGVMDGLTALLSLRRVFAGEPPETAEGTFCTLRALEKALHNLLGIPMTDVTRMTPGFFPRSVARVNLEQWRGTLQKDQVQAVTMGLHLRGMYGADFDRRGKAATTSGTGAQPGKSLTGKGGDGGGGAAHDGSTSEEEGGTASGMAPVFLLFDRDGNGVLDEGELRRGLRAIGFVGAEFNDVFRRADANADGEVSLIEFQEKLDGAARRHITKMAKDTLFMDGVRALLTLADVFAHPSRSVGEAAVPVAQAVHVETLRAMETALQLLGYSAQKSKDMLPALFPRAQAKMDVEQWAGGLSEEQYNGLTEALDVRGLYHESDAMGSQVKAAGDELAQVRTVIRDTVAQLNDLKQREAQLVAFVRDYKRVATPDEVKPVFTHGKWSGSDNRVHPT